MYIGLHETTKSIWKDSFEAGFGISINEGINRVVTRIHREFAGKDWVAESTRARTEEIKDAKNRIEHLQICNMCYLNEYCYEYSKYYYMMFGRGVDNDHYKEVFIRKLPPPWNNYFQNKIREKQFGRSIKAYILGFLIRTIKDEISTMCSNQMVYKQSGFIQDRICCGDTEIPENWRCHEYKQKRKAKNKKYKKYKKFKKKNFKPKRKYFKRKYKTYNKKLIDKKRCRCWNCNEEGHINTECPKKKVRILTTDFDQIKDECEEVNFEEIETHEEIFEEKSDSEENSSEGE